MTSGESQIFKVMSKYEFLLSVTVTVMSVVLPLISSSVPSLYHRMMEGGEERIRHTRVTAVLLDVLKLSDAIESRAGEK